jgi:hypothetical protein
LYSEEVSTSWARNWKVEIAGSAAEGKERGESSRQFELAVLGYAVIVFVGAMLVEAPATRGLRERGS